MAKIIKLKTGEICFVDDEDYEFLIQWKWSISKMGGACYARTNYYREDGKKVTLGMHRLVMNAQKGEQVDHKNHNGLINMKYNLRICTKIENSRNSKKRIDGVTSIYKGVYWDKRKKTGKWKAQIGANNKKYTLGYFYTQEEAALAYNLAAIKYFGEFAFLNIIKNNEH